MDKNKMNLSDIFEKNEASPQVIRDVKKAVEELKERLFLYPWQIDIFDKIFGEKLI